MFCVATLFFEDALVRIFKKYALADAPMLRWRIRRVCAAMSWQSHDIADAFCFVIRV